MVATVRRPASLPGAPTVGDEMVIVEYIQPVCPYCNCGLYVTTARGDAANDYYCTAHGDIEARLVRYVRCEQENGVVLPPAPYETCTDGRVP